MVHLRALCELRNQHGLSLPDGGKSFRVVAGDEFMATEADAVRFERRRQAVRVEAPKPPKKLSKKATPKEG